jgi:hypothetical protein
MERTQTPISLPEVELWLFSPQPVTLLRERNHNGSESTAASRRGWPITQR